MGPADRYGPQHARSQLMARTPRRKVVTTTTTTTTTKVQRPKGPRRAPASAGAGRGAPGRSRQEETSLVTPRPSQQDRPFPYSEVKLRVHSIGCKKTTKEIDKDEISLAAIMVEGTVDRATRKQLAAQATRGKTLSAGKFSKGHVERWPKTRPVATFAAGGWIGDEPRFFEAALVLIEEDEGKLGQVIGEIIDSIEKEATAALTTVATTAAAAALSGVAAGTAAGTLTFPIVGTAVGAAVGAGVGAAVGAIKAGSADDVFRPKRASLKLDRFPDEPGMIPGSKKTITFKGHKGEYDVTISWAVR